MGIEASKKFLKNNLLIYTIIRTGARGTRKNAFSRNPRPDDLGSNLNRAPDFGEKTPMDNLDLIKLRRMPSEVLYWVGGSNVPLVTQKQ